VERKARGMFFQQHPLVLRSHFSHFLKASSLLPVHRKGMPTVFLYDARTSQPLAPGPNTVERSSEHLPWRGFLVEQHRMLAGERIPAISTHYLLAILRGSAARGEIFPEGSRSTRTVNSLALSR
jgi:hypothetical protein